MISICDHTDQGRNLISRVIKNLCGVIKISKIQSSAYHQQSLGSLERSHQFLIVYIRLFEGAKDWDGWLRFAVFSYNINVHGSTVYAPYALVFGEEAYFSASFPSGLPDRMYCDHLRESHLSSLFSKLDNLHSQACKMLLITKEKTKEYYDKRSNPKFFREGEQVYIKKDVRESKKFSPYFYGPFTIKKLLEGRR